MTTTTQIDTETSTDEADGDVLYAIDELEYEQNGEAYLFKVWQRLCWSGGCRICKAHPDGKPVIPVKTTQRSIYSAFKTCSSKVQFITTGMSLLEAVFRILILNGNKPMKFSDIVDRLREFWGTEFSQRIETDKAIQRVLDSENEYHISRVPNTD